MALTLLFKLADELYGLEIDSIQEIIEDPVLYYAPRAEGVLGGAINFHGKILAVIDLPGLLGFEGEQRDHRRLVLTPDCRSLVLTVTSVERIVNIDMSTLQPPPADTRNSAIRGIADFEEIMVNLLDTNEVIEQLEETFAE